MDHSLAIDSIGWFSAAILLLTVSRQVYTQWRDRSCAGVSRWLFAGQIGASMGFLCYSFALHNWVFAVTNAMLVLVAELGQVIDWRNRRYRNSIATP